MLIQLYKEQNKTLRLKLQKERKGTFDICFEVFSEILIKDFGADRLKIKKDASFSKDLGFNRQYLLNFIETITKKMSCSVDVETINENITVADLIKALMINIDD